LAYHLQHKSIITLPVFKLEKVLKTPSAILQIFATSDEGFFKPPLFFRVNKADNELSAVNDEQQMLQLKEFNNFLHTKPAMYLFNNITVNLSVVIPSDHLKNKSSLLWSLCYSMGCHR
jgi:hypothetical protein